MKDLFAVSCLTEEENVKMLQFFLFCMINVTLPLLVSLIYHFYSSPAFIKHFRQNDQLYCHIQFCSVDLKYAGRMKLKKKVACNHLLVVDTFFLEGIVAMLTSSL